MQQQRTADEWHHLLGGAAFSEVHQTELDRALANNPVIQKLETLREKVAPYQKFYWGDLRYKNVPKQIIKEKTRSFPGSENYPPYAFRCQCLTTGQKSRYIKVEEWPEYGITTKDGQDGGPYPFAQDIPDKLAAGFQVYHKRISELHRQALQTRISASKEIAEMIAQRFDWVLLYDEYLTTDLWQEKREHALDADGYKCALTGQRNNLHVHHVHYANVGCECTNDLITLHRDVHNYLHRISAHNMYTRRKYEMEALMSRPDDKHGISAFEDCWTHNDYWVRVFTTSEQPVPESSHNPSLLPEEPSVLTKNTIEV